MDQPFALCSGCDRHVRAGDAACPFCGVAVNAAPVPLAPAIATTSVRIAAIVALATTVGCAPVPVYGAPAYGAPAPDIATTDATDQ